MATTEHRLDLLGLTVMQRARLDAALVAADRGWRVHPVVPGDKRPVFEQWERHATTDRGKITAFWARRPGCNIGTACGPSGLLVVDLDRPKPGKSAARGLGTGVGENLTSGERALELLARRAGGEIPATYTVRTPSGGMHLYYRAPEHPRLGNTHDRLAPLIDTRGHGGYVVAPGSVRPDGAYELIDDRDPVELPGWLVQALAPKPSASLSEPAEVAPERLDAYIAAAIAAQVERVRNAGPRRHNHTLFIAACRLGEFVGADALSHQAATRVLQQAIAPIVASDCDCTYRETNNTITSGLQVGAQRPRRLPPRLRRAA